MRCVAYENKIAAIKPGHHVSIQWSPQVCAGKISNAQQVRDGICPAANQRRDKFLAGLSCASVAFRRRRKTFGIKLHIPDYVLGIDGEGPESDSAVGSIKFVEGLAGPSHRLLATDEPNNFQHLGFWR